MPSSSTPAAPTPTAIHETKRIAVRFDEVFALDRREHLPDDLEVDVKRYDRARDQSATAIATPHGPALTALTQQ